MIASIRRPFGAASIVLVTTGATLAIRILSSITLTRLLAPDAFGLVGIINSIFFAITMVSDIGIQSYLMRHADADNPRFRDVIWTIHLWRSLMLFVIALAAAPVAAMLLAKPQLEWPLIVASSTLLLNGFTSLAPMTEIRAGRIGKLSTIDLSLTMIQTIVTIAIAFWLASAWAIIIAMVLQSALRAVLSYVLFPGSGRRLAIDAGVSRDLFGFSRFVLMSSTLTLAIAQADKFVLARLLTLHDFGFYAIAVNLAAVPLGFLSAYVARVLYPAYARAWNEAPEQLRQTYYSARRNVALLYALATGALAGGAAMFVALLYDHRYLTIGPYLSLLAISACLRLPNLAAAEAMTATGRVQVTLYANIARFVWLMVAGMAGFILFGAIGLVGAVGLIELPPMLYCWVVLRRAGILNLASELGYIAVACFGAVAAYAFSYAFAGLIW